MTDGWTLYARRRPEPGWHMWLLPSQRGEFLVQFAAEQRQRWSGHVHEYSPSFDYWDGWAARVPADTKWRPLTDDEGSQLLTQLRETGDYYLAQPLADGAPPVLQPCPFCGTVPGWRGGGTYITGGPHTYTHWWLKCCGWAARVNYTDPLQLAQARAALLQG